MNAHAQVTVMPARKNYDRVPPVKCPNLVKLCNILPMEKVAELMGVGYSTISRYKAQELCPKSVEKAAQYEVEKRDKSKALVPIESKLVVVKIPPEKVELLTTFLNGMGIKYRRFKD